MKYLIQTTMFLSAVALAHQAPELNNPQLVMTHLSHLQKVNAQIVQKDTKSDLAFAWVQPKQFNLLLEHSHERGACAGFENFGEVLPPHFSTMAKDVFAELHSQKLKNDKYEARPPSEKIADVSFSSDIGDAVKQVNPDNIREWVEWLSAFPTRYYRSNVKNNHVVEMKRRLETMLANVDFPYEVSEVHHSNIDQRSLRVRFTGKSKPDEVVVIGGHFDSIVSFGGSGNAPGADDNASGSSAVVEALRILSLQGQPERSIEFFWYAGEEGGLLGSKDIATNYKSQGVNVIAAMQLDMVMHPGSGVGKISFIRDYTNSQLTNHLKELNRLYVGARTVDSRCGYGCSDHASWHRKGYAAAFPFEAHKDDMNRKIHTTADKINNRTSFEHAAVFSKLAVAYLLDLGHSTAAGPF